MLIDIKPRIRKPPFGSVEIDWGHPLAPDLICVLANEGGGGIINLVQGVAATSSGSPTWGVSVNGVVRKYASASSQYDSVPHIWNGSSDYTIAGRVRFTDLSHNNVLLVLDNINAFHILRSDSAAATLRFYDGTTSQTGGTTLSNAVTYDVAAVHKGTAMSLYLNAIPDVADAVGGNPGAVTGAHLIGQTVGVWFADMFIDYVYAYRRALQASLIMQLHAEPYAFLRPKIARHYFGPLAASDDLVELMESRQMIELPQSVYV
jgi:hypothetical protein